jgi:membrane associated rhomboid family serine protease
MRYNTRYGSTSFFSSGYFPDGVKWLLISNVAIFVLSYLAAGTNFLAEVFPWLALHPYYVIHRLAIWQLATYLFLHGGVWHLLINMFTLWMFGVTLEKDWGTRRFLKYYFICGIGAGLCDVAVNALLGNWNTSTIGASGAIYGLLLAFGVMYPDTTILFSFLFPIKAKYFVMIYGAIELLAALGTRNTGVSNIAHLGGMAFGFIYLKMHFPTMDLEEVRGWYRRWKMQRAKKKFQVYLRKQGSDRDRWVN